MGKFSFGDALGAAGAIFGGIKASEAERKARKVIKQQKEDNESWFKMKNAEDPTQRLAARNIITETMNAIRDNNQATAGSAAVTGATPEQIAAQKAAGTKALASATSSIAQQGEAIRDANEATYLKQKDKLADTEIGTLRGQAKAITDATAQLGGMAQNMAGTAVKEPIKEKI